MGLGWTRRRRQQAVEVKLVAEAQPLKQGHQWRPTKEQRGGSSSTYVYVEEGSCRIRCRIRGEGRVDCVLHACGVTNVEDDNETLVMLQMECLLRYKEAVYIGENTCQFTYNLTCTQDGQNGS